MNKSLKPRPGNVLGLIIATAMIIAVCISPDALRAIGAKIALLSFMSSSPLQAVEYAASQSSETESTTDLTPIKNISINEETEISTPITDTPDDIAKLVEQYEQKAKTDVKDGDISEKNYHTSGRTDSFENVFVKNVNETDIDIESLLKQRADLKAEKSKPCVLIIHTHTTEAYQILDRDFYAAGYTTRSKSPDTSIVRVGRAITQQLEQAGYAVIHDETIYDTSYSGAYDRSYVATEKWIEKYPTIQIVLDIHRDAIQLNGGVKVKPTAEIDGKKAAQIMIISGCQEQGNGVENFPDWRQNLVFAVQLQKQLEDDSEGITRPLYFCPREYNMNLTHCSLLIEMGSDANTLGEAVYSGALLGRAVARLMDGYT